jgi:hypothetical protein
MAEGGEGVGACHIFSTEGASGGEEGVIYDLVEMTRLCYAGGGRWVVVHGEVADHVWHGPSPERALAAYLRERLEGEEGYLESLPGKCEEYLVLAREARGRGDPREAEWWEREHRSCLRELEERRVRVRLLRSAVEGLRTGRIKLRLEPLRE